MKPVSMEELQRGDLIIVRWRDASDVRGFLEDFGEPQWVKDWGFFMGIVGSKKYPELAISKDVAEGHQAWGISRIPLELVGEVWLWIPREETRKVIPELGLVGRRFKVRRYDTFMEVETSDWTAEESPDKA